MAISPVIKVRILSLLMLYRLIFFNILKKLTSPIPSQAILVDLGSPKRIEFGSIFTEALNELQLLCPLTSGDLLSNTNCGFFQGTSLQMLFWDRKYNSAPMYHSAERRAMWRIAFAVDFCTLRTKRS